MIDTISASAFVGDFKGWKSWKKADDEIGRMKTVNIANGAPVTLLYYPTGYLTISFSASRVQHGENSIPYDFEKYYVVEDEVKNVLLKETDRNLELDEFILCRLDLNKNFIRKTESVANEVLSFLNKIHPEGYQERNTYDNGGTLDISKGRNGKRAYRKDIEQQAKNHTDEILPPTVRLEFQLNKRRIKRTIDCRPTLQNALRKKYEILKVWKRIISKSGLDLKIYTYNELLKRSQNILTKTEQEILKLINNNNTFAKENRNKELAVIRKLKKYGICAYACNVQIAVDQSIFCEIINDKRKVNICKYEIANKKSEHISQLHTSTKTVMWFLDSS